MGSIIGMDYIMVNGHIMFGFASSFSLFGKNEDQIFLGRNAHLIRLLIVSYGVLKELFSKIDLLLFLCNSRLLCIIYVLCVSNNEG